ncbi:hypothetical protein GcC1_053047, partial [Golovinomyces cichoracearum]
SCDYYFAGLLPEESHISRLPLWPVPPGWKSKSWRKIEHSSSLTPDKSNYRPPTLPTRSSSNIRSYQDPPVCDIDDFTDSGSCDQKHVGFHKNAVHLHVPDVPLYDIPSSRNDSVGKEPEKESNLAELQQEADQLEANLAEARKRQRIDRGDEREVLDDDFVDDNTHTAGSRPSSGKK